MHRNRDKLLIEALKRYFPDRVFRKLEKDPTKIRVEGERRRVTVLFGDLSGFTSLTERLKEPEEIVKIINRYFSRMLEIVDKYGGDLDKLVGDAIMVLFGAPVAHKDDPLRAVSAALDMVNAVNELGKVEIPEGKIEINMSIGINTGEVVALNMGSDKRMEYTVMGDVVNTASRLEGIAKPGEVIISESTYNEVKEEIKCEEQEKVSLKGKKEPVKVYRALHYEVKEAKKEAFPLVDREEEKKKLLEYIEHVKHGNSKKIYISGTFGIGKSRLCDEVLKEVEGIRVIHLRGQKFTPNVPYYMIRDWIKEEYGESPPDDLKIFFRKVEEETDFKKRVESGFKKYLKGLLNVSPLLIRIEDWEHIDALTSELLTKLDEQERLLIIAESEETTEEFEELELKPLKESYIREISEKILDYSVSEQLLKFLLNKSEGNPYSLRLLLGWLKEKELYEKVGSRLELKEDLEEEKVPVGLSSLMVEKLDSYPEDLNIFIKNASIFGERFNLDDYLYIYSEKEENLKEAIDIALDEGIISKKGKEFFFKNPPFREAAYNSILNDRRKELHSKIALHLEERLGDRTNEWASILAFHYKNAENQEKAAEYLMIAGVQARRYSDFKSSISHFKNAELIYKEFENSEGIIKVKERVGDIYRRIGRFDKAKEELERGIKIGEEKQSGQIVNLYETYAHILIYAGDYDKSEKYFEKALFFFKDKEDEERISVTYQNIAGIYLKQSKYEKALSYYEKALNLAVKSERLDVSADSKFSIGHIYYILGKGDIAEKVFKESLEIKRHLKDKDGESKVLLNLGVLFINAGRIKEAEDNLKESLKVAEETGNLEYRARANINIGAINSMKGKLNESLKNYRDALADFSEIGSVSDINTTLANIAEIYELKAKLDLAEKNYKEALKGVVEIGDRWTEAYISIKLGRINLWRGNFKKALEEFNKAKEITEGIGVSDLKFDALQFMARVNLRIGLIDKAEEFLSNINPEEISNFEVKGRYLITKALIEEAKWELKNALELGKKLVELGMESGNSGVTLDGFGTLLRLEILSNEDVSKIISKTKEIIDENVFVVRNLWIILSMSEYYLEIGKIDRATLSTNYALKKAKEHDLRSISLEAYILSGRINEIKENEDDAKKDFENAVELLLKIAESLNEEQRIKYFETHIDYFSSLLHHYYKMKNLLIVISLLKKLPEKLQLVLLKERKDENASFTEEIIRNLGNK
jgi:class 3 adenylate cyclase/tetratricopeptide (TPR) repeat protein